MLQELIAGGGIAATVAAAWNQIRNAFAYCRSQVLVKVHIEHTTARRVTMFMAQRLKKTPGGDLYVTSRWFSTGAGRSLLVPFLTRSIAGIWVFKGYPFIFKDGNLIAPRGFPIEQLVTEALAEAQNKDTVARQFWVRDLIGSAGRPYDNGSAGSPVRLKSRSDSPEASEDVPNDALPVTTTSFMYDASEYTTQTGAFDSLYYSDEVMRHVANAQLWLDRQMWYRERSIPWRRGWLLYGPGGTGKSSMARAVAQQLQVPLYRFHLSTMLDNEFLDYWSDMDLPADISTHQRTTLNDVMSKGLVGAVPPKVGPPHEIRTSMSEKPEVPTSQGKMDPTLMTKWLKESRRGYIDPLSESYEDPPASWTDTCPYCDAEQRACAELAASHPEFDLAAGCTVTRRSVSQTPPMHELPKPDGPRDGYELWEMGVRASLQNWVDNLKATPKGQLLYLDSLAWMTDNFQPSPPIGGRKIYPSEGIGSNERPTNQGHHNKRRVPRKVKKAKARLANQSRKANRR